MTPSAIFCQPPLPLAHTRHAHTQASDTDLGNFDWLTGSSVPTPTSMVLVMTSAGFLVSLSGVENKFSVPSATNKIGIPTLCLQMLIVFTDH